MRRPVEVLIYDGLGNQMFQYALGRALSLRTGRPLVLDTLPLYEEPVYRFDLRHLRLGKQKVRNRPAYSARRLTVLRMMASRGWEPIRLVTESGLEFSPEILTIDKPCILQGYWQSERYFESIAGQLREEFSIVEPQDPRSADFRTRIRKVESVALHVRRGDYVSLPACNAFHGTCSKEYYDAALRLVLSRLPSGAELFVFSDDMAWSRENIRFPVPTTYVDWNQSRNYEDLRLMSSCRALIMANSSFSWWAGWLNPRPDKLVIAPRQWYRAPGAVSDLPNSPWLIAI
jgi:hypothetical protein